MHRYDEIYEFSDLPEDEFVAQHTGLIFRNSSLMREDAASERFFSQESLNRATVPAAYDAIKAGLVTPVRNQGNCGSCVAFATAAVVETCFAKHLGMYFFSCKDAALEVLACSSQEIRSAC